MPRVLATRFPTPALWFTCVTPRLPVKAWSLVTTWRLPVVGVSPESVASVVAVSYTHIPAHQTQKHNSCALFLL